MSKCKVCKTEFFKTRPMQQVCGLACAMQTASIKAAVKRIKAEQQDKRETKAKLETRSDWLKKAQTAVNAWVRARDVDLPCISCQRHHQGQYHAGHYRSVGACPELRFEPDNIHKQCAPCNNHLSGNIVAYRPRLIDKIGLERLNWIEGKHDAKKYTMDELKAITKEYKAKLKSLTKIPD